MSDGRTSRIASETAELIGLLTEQCGLYEQLAALSEAQRRLITSNEPEKLLTLLGDRQKILDCVEGRAAKMRPFQQRWGQMRREVSPADAREVDRLLGKVNALLAGILEQDKADTQLLAARKSMTGQEMSALKSTRAAGAAYVASAYGAARPAGMDGSMSVLTAEKPSRQTVDLTPRERELGAIIEAYNQVTEQLKVSHETLGHEVNRLRVELEGKNRELRRREKLVALGELAAGVAHEIRNPLGGIRLFASLLARDLKEMPDSLRVVNKIIQGVTSLESIVTGILDFARPPEPEPGRVRLDVLAGEVLELAAERSERSKVNVTVGDELGGVMLLTDSRLLQRALLNLVLNAVEACGGGDRQGEVAITLGEVNEQSVVLAVVDNGPGIAAELLDRIFNPFFTTKDTGTGLGLAIVHQIVESLGGSIQASNRVEGGAMFAMRLPRQLGGGCGSKAGNRAG